MKETAGPSGGVPVHGGWVVLLLLFGLVAFTVDATAAVTVLVVGLFTAIPLKAIGFDATILDDLWETPRRNSFEEDQRDALSLLRSRYARGELTETEFERKLERLLETETIEQIEEEFEFDRE